MEDPKTTVQKSNVKVLFLLFIALAVAFLISLFLFFELSWGEIKGYPILGIPLGIIIWSYLGGLAKIIHTIYQGTKIDSFFKWFIVNSLMSIVFGAAVFLFIMSIAGTEREYVIFLIIFIAAYFSDIFILRITAFIQNRIPIQDSSFETKDSSILDKKDDIETK